jgi:nitroimidazol reductase NimA-like FMN-containing flavoprotein (pyridoxamine 5'-phosphate oxidase superfamily)
MTSWNEAAAAAPELAAAVRARFEATGLGYLATLRADGSPRLSGVEPSFWNGELWLGMMPDSRKALDLRRDPRFALHAANIDKEVKEGDARVSGRAVEVDDDETKRGMGAAFAAETGFDPNEHGPFHLFRADLTELYTLRAAGDHLVLEFWSPDAGLRTIDRY